MPIVQLLHRKIRGGKFAIPPRIRWSNSPPPLRNRVDRFYRTLSNQDRYIHFEKIENKLRVTGSNFRYGSTCKLHF